MNKPLEESLQASDVDTADPLPSGPDGVIRGASLTLAVVSLIYSPILVRQPAMDAWEPLMFGIAGSALLLASLLAFRRSLSVSKLARVTALTATVLVLTRLVMVYVNDTFAAPSHGMFMPVHAYLPMLYLLFVVLLPFPLSGHLAVPVWLVSALVVSVGSLPYLDQVPAKPYLLGTLLYIWFGQALFLVLMIGWGRLQQRQLASQRQLVASARASSAASARAEQRFRTLFEQAAVGIGVLADDRNLIDANARMAELTGYSINELRGISICQLLPPDDRAAGTARLTAFLASDGGATETVIERRLLRRDGSTVWVANHLRQIPATADQPATAIMMSIDISARRAAEEAIALQQRELRAIFDQTTVGIAMVDASGRWLNVNQRLCTMLGRSEAELLATDFQSVTHPDDLADQVDQVEAVIAGTIPGYVVEKRYLRADGETVWARLQVSRVDATAERPARFVSVIEDISERKRLEREAEGLRRVSELHVDHTPLAVIEWSPEMRIRRWSKRAEALFGWSEAEVIGLSPFDWRFIHEDEIEHTEQVIAAIRETTAGAVHSRNRHYHRDGGVMWCQWHTSTLRAPDGSVVAYYSLGDDITAEIEMQQSLVAAEARYRVLFDQVAAGIGRLDHEGRWIEVNPMLAALHDTTPELMLGRQLVDDALPDDVAAVSARLARLLAGEIDDYTVERAVPTGPGSTRWLMAHMRRVPGPRTDAPQAVVMALDISARKAAEAAAEEHQRVREFHLENTPLAAIEWSPDFRVQRWSKRAAEMFGWEEHEVLGRKASEWPFVHEEDMPRVFADLTRLEAEGAIHGQMTNRNYHKDGRTLWCQWHNSLLRNTHGEVVSVFSLVNDFTDEQFTTLALRDSQARFRSIFEQAAVGIVMIDGDGNWLMVNQRFREIVGYDNDDLLQHTCLEITEAKDRVIESKLRERLLAGEIADYTVEKRYRRRDGKPVWVSVHARRLETDEKAAGAIRISLVVIDITERRKAEAEIRKLNTDLESRVAFRTAQLNDTVRNAALRNQELRIVGEMMALLPAARDQAEASRIIDSFLPQIFSRCSGAVWLAEGAPDRLSLLGKWGPISKVPSSLSPDDCWGIRRAQTLRVENPSDPLFCPHLIDSHDPLAQRPHACVPVLALGETVGMIHLEWSERLDAAQLPPDPVLIRNVAEQVGLAVGNVRLREELRRQAVRDPLTGLYNRRHFDETLKIRIAEHARGGRRFALLMIDIDHFKRVNDEHGHDIGDEVLRETAVLLAQTVRSDEAAFRLGGEEFVMIVSDGEDSGEQAAGCAERVRREVEAMRVLRGDRPLPSVTVSIGMARFPNDVPHGANPLRIADAALYAAKRTGRNRVCTAGTVAGQDGVKGLVKR